MWGKFFSHKVGLIGVKSKVMKNKEKKSKEKMIRVVFWLKKEN